MPISPCPSNNAKRRRSRSSVTSPPLRRTLSCGSARAHSRFLVGFRPCAGKMAHPQRREEMKRAAFWLLLGCACLTACNRSTPPQTAQATPVQPAPAPDKVPDFESEPLTQAHLDLYLSVMQQAVGDRQHISDADKKVLADEADWY